MTLKCFGSGSSGNSYALISGDQQILIIDAGVKYKTILKGIDYRISDVAAVIVTHKHLDHSLSVNEFLKRGIKVYRPYENYFKVKYPYNFEIYPFECKHNVPCCGFYIKHPEIGSLIYATDTRYIKYHFRDVQHIIVEYNWSKKYVDTEAVKYQHELEDHMEQSTCMDFLKANNSDSLKTVILCHLSDSAIDADEAVTEAKKCVNGDVTVDFAASGKQWELTNGDKCPFM